MVLSVFIIIQLLVIAYSDFKSRLIPVWMLILLAALVSLKACIDLSWYGALINSLQNVIVIICMTGCVWAWYALRRRKTTSIINREFGSGDLVFMLICSIYFSPLVFISFQIVSIVVLLTVFGFYIAIRKVKEYPIPLAGSQAVMLIAIEIMSVVGNQTIQFRDDIVMSFLISLQC